jgi:hypothetical protein
MIEQYKQEDGWYQSPDLGGCDYETAGALLQSGIFGFCMCGSPDENLLYIAGGLEIISEWTGLITFDEWEKKLLSHFGNRGAADFFFYWADKEGYSEHGGCIPG